MNINIICVGKIKDKYINDGIAEFSKRMTNFVILNIIELKEYNKEDSINISIEKESLEILKAGIYDYIEVRNNKKRIHSNLGFIEKYKK